MNFLIKPVSVLLIAVAISGHEYKGEGSFNIRRQRNLQEINEEPDVGFSVTSFLSRLRNKLFEDCFPTPTPPTSAPNPNPNPVPSPAPAIVPTPAMPPAPVPSPLQFPGPEPTPVSVPTNPTPPTTGTFRLRLFWTEGYEWQDDPDEQFFCAFYNYDRSFCYYNNVEQRSCRDDQMYVDQCGRSWDDRYRFIFTGNDEVMIQTAVGNLCWEWDDSGRQIYLENCNSNNSDQRWVSPQGSFGGSSFEISPKRNSNLCTTQAHHPKNREVVELHGCGTARDSDTSLWERY